MWDTGTRDAAMTAVRDRLPIGSKIRVKAGATIVWESATTALLTLSGSNLTGGSAPQANGQNGGGTYDSWDIVDPSDNARYTSPDNTGLTVLDDQGNPTSTIVNGNPYTVAVTIDFSAWVT